MKLFKRGIVPISLRRKNLGEPVLTLRLWNFTGSSILNLMIFTLLAAYLLPLVYTVVTSVKQPQQISAGLGAPLYPAINPTYHYQGIDYSVMEVPTADGVKHWAMVTTRRTYAEFIDPQNPNRGLIHWDGNWRGLKKVYVFSPTLEAFVYFWQGNIPLGVLNTLILVVITEIGVLSTSIAVAYGFSRFRIPGGKWLFYLLIATILIPDSITLLPTYMTYFNLLHVWLPHQPFYSVSIPWNWLPLLVPHLFGSAVFIFLLRQNFLSIPRDLDEAAMLDGAGPLRILIQIILPQSIPVVATVAMLHFFYIWNELRIGSLYLGTNQNFWLLSARLQTPSLPPGVDPQPAIQAGALLLILVPVVVLLAFQRFFMKDMTVTGMEK
jgi:multiple sugar transport system permease protein